ncbi:hypothetical protein P175DRAFT_0504496 [Aspergillus ochraceoroseus IBT 24754]|uniref:Uncharacterized protein n=1 Tax=Aspergillus ochraceoroseus IBT 24754 TaxID=1392256 RepID=A0A2T5LN87_9EURO|nr:uncharacterized protein P175DRAFT_0504496 [Aspergillus ochraceoroseus IBT 24754]PTU17748.1 hypothetical protein P175DRAFT_0504496 [Aspergillus ochraceoroseus IBT 24754]
MLGAHRIPTSFLGELATGSETSRIPLSVPSSTSCTTGVIEVDVLGHPNRDEH